MPLGLDTLAVALALGVAGLPARRGTQISLLFAGFEAAMPLVGLALGLPLGNEVGRLADLIAAGLLAGLGVHLLAAEADDGWLIGMTSRGPLAAIVLGVSISVDELAIGFSAGLLRLSVVALVIAVAAQAFLLTQIGVRLGGRVGRRWREAAESAAGVSLVALGAALLILSLTH